MGLTGELEEKLNFFGAGVPSAYVFSGQPLLAFVGNFVRNWS
jgi:hypothetical protein